MHQNQPGLYTNNLNSHASLLLSASPTIITSPLQNNTNNNPQSSPISSSIASIRRQPSTPLLAASNLDNDSHTNDDSPLNVSLTEGYINFKKPQNEMFKKLDGKIQKIVAAHSNLNKLYALNDFSSLGVGPKRPFELPPQLPPPPPWIPKVAAEYETSNVEYLDDFKPTSSTFVSKGVMKAPANHDSSGTLLTIKPSSLTIDSAISKLHQRRQQQLNQKTNQNVDQSPKGPIPCSSSSLSSNYSGPTITPAQFTQLTQKIKETFETECLTKTQGLSIEAKRKFQENLIALLKEEISSVTKSAKLRFNTPPQDTKPRAIEPKSLLTSSPQTLFNTIRRETSLLLNKREPANRSSLSLLSDQQTFNRQNAHENLSNYNRCMQTNKLQQTIKVIVPPTEYHPCPGHQPEAKGSSENVFARSSDARSLFATEPTLTYQVIRNKIRLFQETHRIFLGKSQKFPNSLVGLSSRIKKQKSSQKSIDKIVDRLQAKWSPSPIDTIDAPERYNQQATSLQQQIIYSSASLLQSSRNVPNISAPTPIPVFRSPLTTTAKGGYFYAGSTGASKIVNLKSKKSKRPYYVGLKIGNYLEKECPQPVTETLTIEQFAKCLNLVRSNDVSLQRHQEQLLQSESKWRMPVGNRPLRLRRLRGERIHMPASASYKATRKVGLQ